jgi:hypothetical protein
VVAAALERRPKKTLGRLTAQSLATGSGRFRLAAEALTGRVTQVFRRHAGPGNGVSLCSAKRQERLLLSTLHIVQTQMILLAWSFPI